MMAIDRDNQVFTVAVVVVLFVLLGRVFVNILNADVNFAYVIGVLASLVGLFFGVQVLSNLKQAHQ